MTCHEILDAKDQPIEDSIAKRIIRELIILNPLLRIRDRRMLKPQMYEVVEQIDHPKDAAKAQATDQANLSDTAVDIEVVATPNASASSSASASASAATTDNTANTANDEGGEELDLKTISHFFADLTSDEDWTSKQIKDGIDVLNTIASKYLVNYQSNNLTTTYHVDLDAIQSRTARDIVTHPVSISTLNSLKNALTDSKPSRARFLLSLLAGAFLMSKGQREIDEQSRPILILEDLESRFHPTLLLNLWAILQLLPIQKVVTTNSAQLLSAMPMSKIRRLCKQYYDVRCYSIRDRAFSRDDARKIAFHIRMNRPNTLFARCWLLVEGETEVWVLNEIADVLGFNLACSGVALIEFAQCGLNPLIKLAKQMGISYHVLTDGDDAGRHYAQTVRDFVGNTNLPDHLSVMPHVDIEHYLYTSGFADVYQRAANIALKNQPVVSKNKHQKSPPPLDSIGNEDGSKDKSAEKKFDRVIDVDVASITDLADQPTKSKKEKNKEKGQDKNKGGSKQAVLKNHSLDSVIKSVLHYNLGKNVQELLKAVNRGRLQGQSKKAQIIDISQLSKGDVSAFYHYVHNLIMEMPRPSHNLTKRQSRILNILKSERALLLDQVNRNEQRLNKQNAANAAAAAAETMANLNKNKAKADKDKASVNASTSASTSAFSRNGNSNSNGNGSGGKSKVEKADKIAKIDTKNASSDDSKAVETERLNGKTTNAAFGAWSDAELSKKGMSVKKVIEAAIHKNTKPGMAILVSEAMHQRGPDSVPLLFKTMFRKIRRLAQNEFGLE